MNKKSVVLIAPILLILSMNVFSQTVFCPPETAIHCTNGICIVDASYSKNWRFFVTRKPNQVAFGGVFIKYPSSSAVCSYFTDRLDFLTLNSISIYSPDRSNPGQWVDHDNGYSTCGGLGSGVTDCPMK